MVSGLCTAGSNIWREDRGYLSSLQPHLVAVLPVADAAAAPRALDFVRVGARVVEAALRHLPSLDLGMHVKNLYSGT